MNIFALDLNPTIAARWHCDAHVIKMILETAQLLCSAHHATNSPFKPPYRATHLNHPSSLWARECRENYIWLSKLGLALCVEYTLRYGKVHKTQSVIETLSRILPLSVPANNGYMTPFAMAMPHEHKVIGCGNPIMAYRSYYQTKREGKLGTWKIKEHRPPWWSL